jgi:hypothetical protein
MEFFSRKTKTKLKTEMDNGSTAVRTGQPEKSAPQVCFVYLQEPVVVAYEQLTSVVCSARGTTVAKIVNCACHQHHNKKIRASSDPMHACCGWKVN